MRIYGSRGVNANSHMLHNMHFIKRGVCHPNLAAKAPSLAQVPAYPTMGGSTAEGGRLLRHLRTVVVIVAYSLDADDHNMESRFNMQTVRFFGGCV